MSLKFAVLGSGPSGMMAAHAVSLAGFDPVILSIKKPSRQYGAQWLHEHIPEMTSPTPDGEVTYHLRGGEVNYRRKVYGRKEVSSSFGKFVGDGETQEAWDLRSTYKKLWTRYELNIINTYIDQDLLRDLVDSENFDYIVSTIPAKDLCFFPGSAHDFDSQPVWVYPQTPVKNIKDNTVIYSGEDDFWYRTSKVFGHATTEVPFRNFEDPPGLPGIFPINKPISTNCTCWDGLIMKAGRYGQWKKGVLTNHVFHEVREFVNAMTGR